MELKNIRKKLLSLEQFYILLYKLLYIIYYYINIIKIDVSIYLLNLK